MSSYTGLTPSSSSSCPITDSPGTFVIQESSRQHAMSTHTGLTLFGSAQFDVPPNKVGNLDTCWWVGVDC